MRPFKKIRNFLPEGIANWNLRAPCSSDTATLIISFRTSLSPGRLSCQMCMPAIHLNLIECAIRFSQAGN